MMTALVIFDSVYGNTENVAKAIAAALGLSSEVKVLRVFDAYSRELESIELLVVGSPTHGGRPTPAILEFLTKIPATALKDVSVAAFDTRFLAKEKGFGLRALMRVVGYAAPRIGESLKRKGGQMAASPEGFIVEQKEGPLKDGELERAAAWGKGLVESKSFPVSP